MGSFDDSLAARYQFALLLLIIDAFKLENQIEHVELFDPLFSDADIRVIKNHYGLDVISSNERAMKTCDANLTTLFFMPHCPKALYNNLLYANWSNDRLNRLIIFGNSFSHLDSIGIDPNLYSYLKDSLYLLDEIKLEDECECTNAFAELSFNIFKIKNTPELDCMKNKLKPVYDSCCLNAPIYTDNEEVI